jgi:hypothetical protein
MVEVADPEIIRRRTNVSEAEKRQFELNAVSGPSRVSCLVHQNWRGFQRVNQLVKIDRDRGRREFDALLVINRSPFWPQINAWSPKKANFLLSFRCFSPFLGDDVGASRLGWE